MLNFKGMRFPIDVVLVCSRWYVAYPLSYWHREEMMAERGVSVDHSSINRWAIRFLPFIKKMARKHKQPVGDCIEPGLPTPKETSSMRFWKSAIAASRCYRQLESRTAIWGVCPMVADADTWFNESKRDRRDN